MSSPVRPGDRRASIAQLPSANTTSVKVVVRIRPTTSADATSVPQRFQRVVVQPVSETALQADNPSPSASGAGRHAKQLFTFDRVVGPDEGQSRVYESAASLVDAYLAGYNATVLAYGQTSSGKSYTMGTDRIQDEATDDPSRQGVTPRAVADIFARLKQAEQDANGALTFTAKVSYVEIYNEDLIDLLAGDIGVRPTVQIREDKQGRIFWSGLREIKVSSAADVMNLLAAGSAVRQTGATDMNAQSSRSHAIFSLTVTQQRWSGTGPPSAMLPPTTPASPTHNRRVSALPRMSSPAPGGRPGTPSSDRPASRFGLRPPSTGGRPSSPQGEEAGTWTNVTSKFHFVDLAGSERLKRTAAAGERAKEGISINAGLSALGNVISALGDPTKKATHIPYRDSKLTRLLQDSLGGNARTMMIACISPAEFNLHETLSTLKYANRARNIKNRAEVNESEAGWDDLVYLQRTIVKLRAELATIKAGDLKHSSNEGDDVPAGTGDVFDASLQQRVALLTAELAKAQAVGPSQGDQPATSLSRDQFAAAVEPIVEEYERSLSALESQLALTRAALGHSEEEMRELEHRVEEEAKANQANEALIEELRNRVAKLTERESTTEAYVRDIESKLKEVDEAGEAHGSAMSDLRRELAKGREQTLSTEMYIKELEARLAEADTATTALRRQIETLERDVAQREEAHRELEARVALLDNSSETKLLIAEIDEKDRRLSDLERSLDDVKANANEARAEISRLQQVADSEKAEKEDLLGRVRTLEHNGPRQDLSMAARRPAEAQGTVVDPNIDDLAELQAAHEQTVRELEEARQKYRDALKEIEDLHGQAQEARLLRSPPSISELSERTTSTEFSSRQKPSSDDSAEDEVGSAGESPSTLRTAPRTPAARRSVPLADQHGLSFRSRGHGASSPSHLRWASLQQELSSAVSFQNSCPTSPGSTLPLASSPLGSSPSRPGTSVGPTERSYDQLKEEIRKLQEVLQQRDDEISTLESTLQQQLHTPATTPSLGDSPLASFSPLPDQPETPPRPSVVVDDGLLSPRTVARFDSLRSDFVPGNGLGLSSAAAAVKPFTAEAQTRLDELMMSMAAKERAHRETVEKLDAEIMSLRRANDELTILSRDQAENMAAEIDALRVESAKVENAVVDRAEFEQLQSKLAASEEAYADLERRTQAQADVANADAKNSLALLEASHKAALDDIQSDHVQKIELLRTELASAHQERLEEESRRFSRDQIDAEELAKQHEDTTATAVAEALAQLRQEHAAANDELTAQLQAVHADKKAADLADHAYEVEKLVASHEGAVLRLKDEHAERLRAGEEERARLSGELEKVEATLRDVRDQLAAAKQSHEDEIAAILEKHEHALLTLQTQLAADHAKAMSEQRDEHDVALAEAASARELNESTWKEEAARGLKARLDRLRNEHEAALAAAEATLREAHAAELERQQARIEHLETTTTSLESAVLAHQATIDALKSEHAQVLESLNNEHAQSIEAQRAQSQRDLEEMSATHEETTRALQSERDHFRESVESLSEEIGTLKQELSALQERTATMARDHDVAAKAAAADVEARETRNNELAAEIDDLQRQKATESQRLCAIAAADLSAAEERHATSLTTLREEHDRTLEKATKELAESCRQLRKQLESSVAQHQSEIESLEKAHAEELHSTRADHEEALRVVREEAAHANDTAVQERESVQLMQTSLADSVSALQKKLDGVQQELKDTIAERDALAARLDQLAEQQASTADAHALEVNSLRQKLKLQDSIVTAKSPQNSDLQKALQALDALQDAFVSQSEECARLHGPTRASDHTSNGSGEGPTLTRDSNVAADLTRYRDLVTKLDLSLAVAVKEKEALARQLARMSLSSAPSFAAPPTSQPPSRPLSPFNELPPGPAPPVLRAEHFLSNASQFHAKMPPPTPPPSIPPPPAPETSSAKSSRSSEASTSGAQVQGSTQEAEALEELARLQKEFAQREADLQAQRDLVNTLESALNDSERNLRKARQTSNEHARERDQYRETAERLERAAAEARSASEKYRQSMIDLEERLQEQRTREARAARARLELEARMDEANKRKSKFACF